MDIGQVGYKGNLEEIMDALGPQPDQGQFFKDFVDNKQTAPMQDWHPTMRSPSSPNYRSWAQPDIGEDFQVYMGPPDSSTGGGRWSNQLPLETNEEFEKRILLEQLQRRGGGISI